VIIEIFGFWRPLTALEGMITGWRGATLRCRSPTAIRIARADGKIKARHNAPKGTMCNKYNTISNARMVYLSVPVELTWLTRGGSEVSESTATLQISAGGAIVLDRRAPRLGADVRPTNCESKRTTIARTAGMRPSPEPNILELALEFKLEDETFWGPGTSLTKAETSK